MDVYWHIEPNPVVRIFSLDVKNDVQPGVAEHDLTSAPSRQRQAGLCELEGSLVRVSSRTPRTTRTNSVWK